VCVGGGGDRYLLVSAGDLQSPCLLMRGLGLLFARHQLHAQVALLELHSSSSSRPCWSRNLKPAAGAGLHPLLPLPAHVIQVIQGVHQQTLCPICMSSDQVDVLIRKYPLALLCMAGSSAGWEARVAVGSLLVKGGGGGSSRRLHLYRKHAERQHCLQS